MSHRKLARSRSDRIIAGVCGGFAEYFGVESYIVRIFWAISILAGGLGLLAYLVFWFLLPEGTPGVQSARPRTVSAQDSRMHRTVGILLIILGALFLVSNFAPMFSKLWPLVLVAGGIALLARGAKK